MRLKDVISIMYMLRMRTVFHILGYGGSRLVVIKPDLNAGSTYDLTFLEEYKSLDIIKVEIDEYCITVAAVEKQMGFRAE